VQGKGFSIVSAGRSRYPTCYSLAWLPMVGGSIPPLTGHVFLPTSGWTRSSQLKDPVYQQPRISRYGVILLGPGF